jgi:hypothetical protein
MGDAIIALVSLFLIWLYVGVEFIFPNTLPTWYVIVGAVVFFGLPLIIRATADPPNVRTSFSGYPGWWKDDDGPDDSNNGP